MSLLLFLSLQTHTPNSSSYVCMCGHGNPGPLHQGKSHRSSREHKHDSGFHSIPRRYLTCLALESCLASQVREPLNWDQGKRCQYHYQSHLTQLIPAELLGPPDKSGSTDWILRSKLKSCTSPEALYEHTMPYLQQHSVGARSRKSCEVLPGLERKHRSDMRRQHGRRAHPKQPVLSCRQCLRSLGRRVCNGRRQQGALERRTKVSKGGGK